MPDTTPAEDGTEAAQSGDAKRILVAEDSSAIQDLLQLILTQRGLSVDIVEDGKQALDAIRTQGYDIALLDFNMPEMTGLEVVAKYLEDPAKGPCPHFVAITGDVQGLLESQDNCEHFDRVMAKPLDINEVLSVIGELGRARPEAPGIRPVRPAAGGAPSRSPIEDVGYRFLRWPYDADRRRLTAGAEGYDAVLVYEADTPDDLAPLWQGRGLNLLPVIDLTGRLGAGADFDASGVGGDVAEHVTRLIDGFGDRRAALHRDVARSEDIGDKLLARIHVSGADLIPRLDGNRKGLVGYNLTLAPETVRAAAGKLVGRGLLAADFFERLHVCGNCRSARMIVREECPSCRSAQIEETSYLHHFRCAYQGPEADFRTGDDLICPKCRVELRHFGRDYDRPGTMLVCQSCGHAAAEPAVGFVCADCGTRSEGEAVATRDVHLYRLTRDGIGYLEAGAAFLGMAQQVLRFTDLPLDLVVALNGEARRYNETGAAFTLLSIAYRNERPIAQDHGARQFAATRRLFTELLGQRLDGGAKVISGGAFDYALLPGTGPEAVSGRIGDLGKRIAAELRFDPGAEISVFGPEDLG
ncbi:response regulator [Thalassovita mangrovi]|uniref:Response regulator n=1 Tax=Thalassovita mangrovi TaxID=2692236 RepID=A0A6L8LS36_9RHOB|nr:response regulator [Thalassovita mangrovi]MYM57440.1 response regulator [Thalassovita mangrovi]